MLFEIKPGFSINPFDLYAMVINEDTGEVDKFQLLLYFSSQEDKCLSLDFDSFDSVHEVYVIILKLSQFNQETITTDLVE